MALRLVLCLLINTVSIGKSITAETTPLAQIPELIVQLESDDFATRENAHKQLRNATTDALPLLEAAAINGSLEVKARAAQLVQLLKLSQLKPVDDIAAILPADAIFYLQTRNLSDALKRSHRQTILGKFLDQPQIRALQPILDAFAQQLGNGDEKRTRLFSQYPNLFGGLNGIALTRIEPENTYPDREVGVIALSSISDDPKTALDLWFQAFRPEVKSSETYKGMDLYTSDHDWFQQSTTRTGHTIIDSPSGSVAALKLSIDRLVENPQGLLQTERYKSAQHLTTIGTSPPLVDAYYDHHSLLKMFGNTLSERDQNTMKAFGISNLVFAAGQLTIQERLDAQSGLFCETVYAKTQGAPEALGKLLTHKVLNSQLAAVCPIDALVFLTLPLDGKLLSDVIDTIENAITRRPESSSWQALKRDARQMLGSDLAESLIHLLQGDLAVYARKPDDAGKYADFGAILETKNAASATLVIEKLKVLIEKITDQALLQEKTTTGGNRYGVAEKLLKKFPYKLRWCAFENRILIASSAQELDRLLELQSGKVEGLNKAASFSQLSAYFAGHKTSGLLFIDTAHALKYGYMLGSETFIAHFGPLLGAALPVGFENNFEVLSGTMMIVEPHPEGLFLRSLSSYPLSGLLLLVPIMRF